jgi:myo-inositol 2-dehydrogenase/D-chiro-inositol 1-dehydrogenase
VIRIGFIGCGGIAQEYLHRLDKLADQAHVVAFCDLDRQRAQALCVGRSASVYQDYRLMLDTEPLDAVFDNLPPFARGDELVLAAERGCAVFTTKPLGLTLEPALRSLAAIEAAGVINSVGYMFRYAGIVDEARRLLAGRPVSMVLGQVLGSTPAGWYAQRSLSGGQIVEQSTHIVDLTRYFAGEVRTVFALGRSGTVPDRVDYEDVSSVTMDFNAGAVGTVVSTCTVWQFFWGCTLLARDVHLELVFDQGTLRGRMDNASVAFDHPSSGYDEQVAAFVKAVSTGDQSQIRSSYRDGLGTFAVTLTAERSMQTGLPEIVDPVAATDLSLG